MSRSKPSRNPYEIQVNTKKGLRRKYGHSLDRVVIPMRFRSIQSYAPGVYSEPIPKHLRVVIPMRFRSIQSEKNRLCEFKSILAKVVIPMRFRSIQSPTNLEV